MCLQPRTDVPCGLEPGNVFFPCTACRLALLTATASILQAHNSESDIDSAQVVNVLVPLLGLEAASSREAGHHRVLDQALRAAFEDSARRLMDIGFLRFEPDSDSDRDPDPDPDSSGRPIWAVIFGSKSKNPASNLKVVQNNEAAMAQWLRENKIQPWATMTTTNITTSAWSTPPAGASNTTKQTQTPSSKSLLKKPSSILTPPSLMALKDVRPSFDTSAAAETKTRRLDPNDNVRNNRNTPSGSSPKRMRLTGTPLSRPTSSASASAVSTSINHFSPPSPSPSQATSAWSFASPSPIETPLKPYRHVQAFSRQPQHQGLKQVRTSPMSRIHDHVFSFKDDGQYEDKDNDEADPRLSLAKLRFQYSSARIQKHCDDNININMNNKTKSNNPFLMSGGRSPRGDAVEASTKPASPSVLPMLRSPPPPLRKQMFHRARPAAEEEEEEEREEGEKQEQSRAAAVTRQKKLQTLNARIFGPGACPTAEEVVEYQSLLGSMS